MDNQVGDQAGVGCHDGGVSSGDPAGERPDRHRAAALRLRQRLSTLAGAEAVTLLAELVRRHVAAVLGHTTPDAVGADKVFRDLGVTSLSAVEICDRLGAATGLAVPASALFGYPTPAALAGYLAGELLGQWEGPQAPDQAGGSAEDPVVVVGIGCRFPGGVDSPEAFWQLLVDGRNVASDLPTDRGWDLATLLGAGAGHSATDRGGFLADIAGFDAAFFGISPREALAMDPQQRLLLEVSWEALERAGIDPLSLKGSATGVFIGTNGQDYLQLALRAGEDLAGLVGTGSAASVLSGRLGYLLGLHGPALSVDTASSASLVAVHLAVQSLRSGECSLAVAGGVTVMSTPMSFDEHTRQGGLAPDGRSKSYAAAADGTAWSEGVGVVLLERLSAARRRGHEVLAVVRGSAINSDGASNGLAAPNGLAQQRAIEQALADAGLAPSDVDAVEGHGSGTTLGDPIEINALLATYGRDRALALRLGSVKSNLGHTQAAGGVAGLIKMVLALRHGLLPKTLHVAAPSSRVDWSAGSVSLLAEATEWPRTGRPSRAAVSSFGISGTNAHVILEQAPPPPPPAAGTAPEPAVRCAGLVPVLLSARAEGALREQARRLLARPDERPEPTLAELGWTLAAHRAQLPRRAVLLADGPDELRRGLAALADGQAAPDLVTGESAGTATAAVFVFPGQGAQWWGMGEQLMNSSEVFAGTVHRCAEALAPFVDWPVAEVIAGTADPALLDRVDVVQPALFTMMVAIAELWRACGVEPAAVIGHSQGEIAAACVAGALSLEDAAATVALRSRMLIRLAGQGGMASVQVGHEQAAELLAPWSGRLSVAAVNGPSAVVVSGAAGAIGELVARCEQDGVRARRIVVDYASHSAQVDEVRDDVLAALAGVRPGPARVGFYSTVTGTALDTTGLDAGYWFTNLRQTVRMEQAVRAAVADGHRIFIEVSPHPVLAAGVQETLDATGCHGTGFVGSLRRGDGGPRRWLTSLAEAYVRGAGVAWPAVLPQPARRMVDLPTYPFQHRRYWPTPSGVVPVAGHQAVPVAAEPEPATADLALRLAGLPERERTSVLVDLVRAQAAAVLGHDGLQAIEPHHVFKEVGFESMTAVELSNRLRAVTGLRLPPSLAFDFPTPLLVAAHLAAALDADQGGDPARVAAVLDRLDAVIGETPLDDADSATIAGRLEAVLLRLRGSGQKATPVTDADIATVPVDGLLALIDEEFNVL